MHLVLIYRKIRFSHDVIKKQLSMRKKCNNHRSITTKYIEDIQIFGLEMPFISCSEAKNAFFMSGEATNEIYFLASREFYNQNCPYNLTKKTNTHILCFSTNKKVTGV